MELSAGPTNPYLPSSTTNYPTPQPNSSTPVAPLPFYASSIHTTQHQQLPPPTTHPAPLDLHVNAPQGNVWVNHPLVMSDGTTPVPSSASEDHARSAAMVLDASSLDTPQPPPPTCPPLPPSFDPSENHNPSPQELPLEKLSLDPNSPTAQPAGLAEVTQPNSQFRRTSHHLPNRSPRRFKDHDSNHGEARHAVSGGKFGPHDHKFNSASSPIPPGNTLGSNGLAYPNESAGTTGGSRDHSHRKYNSSSHTSSQQNSHKNFHPSGRLSNGPNKSQSGGRHGGWKNNNHHHHSNNNLHHSSGSTIKTRSSNSAHNDRHTTSHHSSRAPRASLRSNDEYSSNWYPPPAPSLDGSYPTGLGYNKYGVMEYAQPPAPHPYGESTFYPPPTYRADSTPSNPDPTNPGAVPSSGAVLNMSPGGAGGTIGHHPNPPPRFHVPSCSPTSVPYGSNPLTAYPPSAPPDPLAAYPPTSEQYYGMQNYYPSQYYYPPPLQPPTTMPFSPNGQPEMMMSNMLSPSSAVSYGENLDDSSSNPGYPQQQQQPYYPTYPAPVTQLSYPLDPVRYYILGQCEYYFSSDNLVKDMFLRNCMDAEGWVSIAMIGRFNRIKSLTDDEKLVTEVMKMSGVLEVHDQRMVVRRRDDWEHWILSSSQKEAKKATSEDSDAHRQQQQKDRSGSPNNEGDRTSPTADQAPPSDQLPRIHLPERDVSSGSSEKGSQVAKDDSVASGAEESLKETTPTADDSLVIVTPGVIKNTNKKNLQPTISIGFDPNQVKKNHKKRSKTGVGSSSVDPKSTSSSNTTTFTSASASASASASDVCSIHSNTSDLK